MSTGIEADRIVGPLVRRARRLVRGMVLRVTDGLAPEDRRTLDPVTANYAAWRSMRRHVREWPNFMEAPNHLEILVSPEDWEDYWGIDAARKEQAIVTYVRARAAEKGLWIAGDPQVSVISDDAMAMGEVEVECRFAPTPDGCPPRPASQLGREAAHDATHDATPAPSDARMWEVAADYDPQAMERPVAPATILFVDAQKAGKVVLLGADGFRLVLCSGDCVGAIAPEDEVPDEVNVRLRSVDYPYAEAKHFSIGVVDSRWCVVNHATTGTKVVTRDGARYMIREPEPFALREGDVLYLGPFGPFRFEFPKAGRHEPRTAH